MSIFQNRILQTILIALLIISIAPSAFVGEGVGQPYWIHFKDKGLKSRTDIVNAKHSYQAQLPQKAIARRIRNNMDPVIRETDLPMDLNYIAILNEISGLKIRHQSRWLNAVSVDVGEEHLTEILELPFVIKVSPVRSFFRNHDEETRFHPREEDRQLPDRDYNLDYGRSLPQNEILNVPNMHDTGLSGRGILIGMLDSGFNNLEHNCFAELEVLDEYDFVNDDDNVDDEDDAGNGDHGTKTLSIIGGYEPEQMIGIAYGASFVLGKTENTEWERPVEEDHWVAGIEWMDELGVDIVSSSLTYSNWYDYEDMDGETAVTTIAAEMAVDVGMIVIVSMGNSGRSQHPLDKMGAPADGFRVFGIGATNRDGEYDAYSSVGPTFDGRIKPDFTAQGSNVRFASTRNDNEYGAGMGTSFSAPAIAGLCALLLEANPLLNPLTIRDVLRESSDHSDEPDTLYGWGIPDGMTALEVADPGAQRLNLNLFSGWNLISHNLNFLQVRMGEIFGDLAEDDELLLVKDILGRFYYPARDFDNIPFWEKLDGYWVRAGNDAVIELEGDKIPLMTPIQAQEGWQIVSYLPDFPLSAEVAFSSLIAADNLIIAKDGRGRFILPSYDFNNIPLCRAGKGYMVKVENNGTLVYPRRRQLDFVEREDIEPENLKVAIDTPFNMSLLITSFTGLSKGDEIGFFDSENRLIGSTIFTGTSCGISLWGGEKIDQFPTAKVYDLKTCRLLPLNIEVLSGSEEYIPNDWSVIGVTSSSQDDKSDQIDANLFSVFPIPFNSQVRIRYDNSLNEKLDVVFFDLSGREVSRKSLSGRNFSELIFSTGTWASGAYLLRIQQGNVILGEQLVQHIR